MAKRKTKLEADLLKKIQILLRAELPNRRPSLTVLAAESGLHVSAISRWQHGLQAISPKQVRALHDALRRMAIRRALAALSLLKEL
jgi:hypothetical protein